MESDGKLKLEATLLGTLTWALKQRHKEMPEVRSDAMELSTMSLLAKILADPALALFPSTYKNQMAPFNI